MSENIYKTIELTGSSATSLDDAVRKAVDEAAKTIKNMGWFQVTDTRGHIENNQIAHWQVTIKIGFTLEN